MKKSKLELLRGLREIVVNRKAKPVPDSYWEKEAKIIEELQEENKRIEKAMSMSYETFNRPFTI